jgi:hypothetical protein
MLLRPSRAVAVRHAGAGQGPIIGLPQPVAFIHALQANSNTVFGFAVLPQSRDPNAGREDLKCGLSRD